MKQDGMIQAVTIGPQAECEDLDALVAAHDPTANGNTANTAHCSGKFKDDMTGQPLIDSLVYDARRLELKYFASKGVWSKVPRRESYDQTGKPPITVR